MNKRVDSSVDEKQIIVSFTTFPDRIDAAAAVAENMLFFQTHKPDRVILNLAEDEFIDKSLSDKIEKLMKRGLEVNWIKDNLKPGNKWFYTMKKYPDDIVIIVDDDIIYPEILIENLLKTHRKFPDAIIAGRAHKMTFSSNGGGILPYSKWIHEINEENHPSNALFGTGVGGMLLQTRLFSEELFNKDNFKKYALNQDDVWLKVMAIRDKIPTVMPRKYELEYLDNTQDKGLWFNVNFEGSGNDQPLSDLLKVYNLSDNYKNMGIAYNDIAPKVSVVIPAYNARDNIEQTLDYVMAQTMKDFECIVVNDGSQDNTEEIIKRKIEEDSRFSLINQKNQGASVARNAGLEKASGKYVIFLDADDIYDIDLVGKLYEESERNNTEITICGYNTLSDLDGSIGRNMKTPMIDKLPKDVFSSKDIDFIFNFTILTVWNKIFLRSFLIDNNLIFDKKIRRSQDLLFVGSAMVLADRIIYLDAPLVTYRTDNANSNIGRAAKYPTSFVESLGLLKDFLLSNKLYNRVTKSYDNLLASSCISYLELYEENDDIFPEVFKLVVQRFDSNKLTKRKKDYFYMEDKYDTIKAICDGSAQKYFGQRLSWLKKYSSILTSKLNATEERRIKEKEYYIDELEKTRAELKNALEMNRFGVKSSAKLFVKALLRKIRKS